MFNVSILGRYQGKKEVFSDKVLRCRLRFHVFSGQIPERTEIEDGLLYEAKQVTAHCTVPIVASSKAWQVIYYIVASSKAGQVNYYIVASGKAGQANY